MMAERRFWVPGVAVAVLSSLSGCVLYGGDGDDDDFAVDAAPPPDAESIDAPPPPIDAPLPIDGPVDAGIDAPPAPPTIVLTSPAPNSLITHHDDVVVTALVTGNPITGFEFTVDGAPSLQDVNVAGVPFNGDCYSGCAVTLSWNADKMMEGTHAIAATALGSGTDRATDGLLLRFEDAPEVIFVRPQTDERRGASSVAIEVRIVDRGPSAIAATLAIDNVTALSLTWPDCRFGCTLTRSWDTSTLAAGVHPLRVVAADGAGRTTTRQLDVTLGDIAYVSQIRVTGESDFGALEVEVHLRDAVTNAWLGCTGGGQGLEGVDLVDTTYNVVGWFSDGNRRTIGIEQLAGRNVRLEVSEDDDNQCPGDNGGGDDPIGSSGGMAAANLANLNTGFNNVVTISTRHGRPLTR